LLYGRPERNEEGPMKVFASVAAAAVVAGFVLAGCAADATDPAERTESQGQALSNGPTCLHLQPTSLACALGEKQDSCTFKQQISALCGPNSTAIRFARWPDPSYATALFVATCPDTPEVEALVAAYANVDPVDSFSSDELNLRCAAVEGYFVYFDPNCPSCKSPQ
jgi:hypothetical protein